MLRQLQDRHNREARRGGMTVNYLGHFESGETFGCNAGHKMIYIDAYGEVSPCVFTPNTFGNLRAQSLPQIWSAMTASFRPSSSCFIHENWRRIRGHARENGVHAADGTGGADAARMTGASHATNGAGRLSVEQTKRMMEDVAFSPLPRFYQLYYRRHGGLEAPSRGPA